jgi:hypothetical protein
VKSFILAVILFAALMLVWWEAVKVPVFIYSTF